MQFGSVVLKVVGSMVAQALCSNLAGILSV